MLRLFCDLQDVGHILGVEIELGLKLLQVV